MPSDAKRVVIDGEITVDATLIEKHIKKVTITKYPVEEGISPTDHAREEPVMVMIEGIFSNTPVSQKEQDDRGIERPSGTFRIGSAQVPVRPEIREGPGSPRIASHAQRSLDALLELASSRRAVDVDGPLQKYTNMVLTSLEYTRDAKTGDAVRFSATFEEVRIVKRNDALALPQEVKPDIANATTHKKSQGKKPANPAAPDPDTSWWKAGTNASGWTDKGSGVNVSGGLFP